MYKAVGGAEKLQNDEVPLWNQKHCWYILQKSQNGMILDERQ